MKNPVLFSEKIDALRRCYSNLNSYLETCGDEEDLRAKKMLASHILELEKEHTKQIPVFDAVQVD